MNIGLCGNIPLDKWALELDSVAPGHDIVVGQPNSYVNELNTLFGKLDICIIALDWRVLVPKLYAYAHGDSCIEIVSDFKGACSQLAELIQTHQKKHPAKHLIFSPISEPCSQTGFINRLLQPSHGELFYDCQKIFNDTCRSLVDAYPIDMEELSCQIGKNSAFDEPKRCLFGQPFSDLMIQATIDHVSKMIIQFQKYPLKCLVLDLDNTLWGGVVGEDGYENLILGDSGAGLAFKNLQLAIFKLYRQGVILAISSKNNTCDALEVLERHPHMLIRPDMISAMRINWDDKPKSLQSIAMELKIGLDSMMFVDDSVAERAMMRSVLPEVAVLDLPQDPALFADLLIRHSRFWPLHITPDDLAKGQFYKQDRIRRTHKELSENIVDFLINSNIQISIFEPTKDVLPRIVQLINKTNQFNLATARYAQTDLETLLCNSDNHLFYAQMRDQFGDYGIIAAALVRENTIDSFVLSCRAFGKYAESAFLSYIVGRMSEQKIKRAFGRFIASPKNSMAKDFYKNNGFCLHSESNVGQLWQIDLMGTLPQIPQWIEVMPQVQ